MYKIKGNGLEVYETLDELVKKGITLAWDYLDNYYIRVKVDDYYDNRIWVVNKKNLQVSDMYFTTFIVECIDEAKQIDPEMLKRVS